MCIISLYYVETTSAACEKGKLRSSVPLWIWLWPCFLYFWHLGNRISEQRIYVSKDSLHLAHSNSEPLFKHFFFWSFPCVPPVVPDVAMPSGDAIFECISKPTPPTPSGPAPSASPAAAVVQSPPPKDEKKKKPEKKGNSWRKKNMAHSRVIMNALKFLHCNKTVLEVHLGCLDVPYNNSFVMCFIIGWLGTYVLLLYYCLRSLFSTSTCINAEFCSSEVSRPFPNTFFHSNI